MPGPVVFYRLRGCSLILHTCPAGLDQLAHLSCLIWVHCALYGRLRSYISFMRPVKTLSGSRDV